MKKKPDSEYLRKKMTAALALTLVVWLPLFCSCKPQPGEAKAAQYRNIKLTKEEISKIETLFKEESKWNLGIPLKIKTANLDHDAQVERIVAYSRGSIENFAILKPFQDDYQLILSDDLSNDRWQIIDIKPSTILSGNYDCIDISIRPARLATLTQVERRIYKLEGKSIRRIFSSADIMRYARLNNLIPLKADTEIKADFSDEDKDGLPEYVLRYKSLDANQNVKNHFHIFKFNGRDFSYLPPAATDEGIQQPEKTQVKIRVEENQQVLDKVKSSCQKIYHQVLKSCEDEKSRDEIDPEFDCQNKATSAKLSCLQG